MGDDLLRLKLQIRCGDRFAIGPGKASLLEAIASEGSISGAGRALGMSYRRAWLLVDEMNRCFSDKLVETLQGGGRERGARLTEEGRQVLAAFRTLEAEAARAGESEAYRMLAGRLRQEPLASEAKVV